MINGLGGAFIFSNEPNRLARWYEVHLGFQFESDEKGESYWQVFWALDPQNPEVKFDTTFAIMKSPVSFAQTTPQDEPQSMYGDQPYMLNLRTGDLDALLQSLEEKSVTIIRRDKMEYGKFAWIRDADGNRLELYQPHQA